MDSYVSKPVHADELYRVVEGIVIAERGHRLPASVSSDPDNPQTSADVSTINGEVLDWEAAVKRMLGREDQLNKVGELFLAECPKMMDEIRDAVANRDVAKTLQRTAHSLKGSPGIFAAQRVVQAAARLENMGRNGPLDDAAAALANLEREFQLLMRKLSEHCSVNFDSDDRQCR